MTEILCTQKFTQGSFPSTSFFLYPKGFFISLLSNVQCKFVFKLCKLYFKLLGFYNNHSPLWFLN